MPVVGLISINVTFLGRKGTWSAKRDAKREHNRFESDQEVLLAQFSLYVHKGGLKPDSFHFESDQITVIGDETAV